MGIERKGRWSMRKNKSHTKVGLIVGIVVISFALLFILNGCDQGEVKKLRSENEALQVKVSSLQSENETMKSKVDSLEQKLSRLKETADYHYQQGVDFLSSKNYEGAKKEFQTVIEKYPTSPLVISANQQLPKVDSLLAESEAEQQVEEETRKEEQQKQEQARQQEEGSRPRSPEEAIAEWKRFRNNEDNYKGTITTWRFPVAYISYENPLGYLDRVVNKYGSDYAVVVQGPGDYTYQAAALVGRVPIVKEKDWIVVTGKFQYVSSDNVVILSPIRVKNEGFK